MKHTWSITAILVALYFLTQVIGLAITHAYIDTEATAATGNVTFSALPFNTTRPDITPQQSPWYILGAVLMGTALLFVLVKFHKINLWKAWFFLSVFVCLTFAFGAFVGDIIAAGAALVFALLKIYRPNVVVHNFTELFLYGGLAAIFVPILNLPAIVILLVMISVYDAFAVWKSKHMITLAKFQTKAKMFAGLSIPYALNKPLFPEFGAGGKRKSQPTAAILGGGDIAFPLLFAGVVMKQVGFLESLVVPLFASLALLVLLIYGRKGKFYPAMPFFSIGCALGYAAVLLI